MSQRDALHSRSAVAGYEPEYLQAAKVLVVGLGALGQNVVQNLALLGIGELLLVDFDEFEAHNATRSPFYPTLAEAAELGLGKAPVVARRAAAVSTSAGSAVYYSRDLIQVLGDGAVAWADVVVAAVDSMTARAWLAERCRLRGRPMVEGGFSGPDFNLSAFAATSGAPCYRCGRPGRESGLSCTAYALAAERKAVVPAIQTTAAVLAGYLAEQVVQLLHGRLDRLGYRSYGNIRQETLRKARLMAVTGCPGIHWREPVIGLLRGIGPLTTVREFVAEIAGQFGDGTVQLSESAIPATSCTACRKPCLVQATEAAWLASPRCVSCGGPWPVSSDYRPDNVRQIGTADTLTEELASTLVARLGIRGGAALAATFPRGRAGLLVIDGDVLDAADRATPADRVVLDTAELIAIDSPTAGRHIVLHFIHPSDRSRILSVATSPDATPDHLLQQLIQGSFLPGSTSSREYFLVNTTTGSELAGDLTLAVARVRSQTTVDIQVRPPVTR
jgi:molybdopterin/thiamine biosynthesis adenylyltransferase